MPFGGDGLPGTSALGVKYRGELPAVLEERTDLAPEFIETVVRGGLFGMPITRKTEVSESELEDVIAYVREVKAAVEQPVTVADNYEWWIKDGAPLAAEVDFLGIHTYPAWEHKTIDEALDYTIENIRRVREALPDKPIAILEAGWATTAAEFSEQASEANQARYYDEIDSWARDSNITVFFFEAFDEPWKGNPDNPIGAEKHWGIFFVDRTPKDVMQR